MFLTTDRLLLREFVQDDWPAVLAYQKKPEYLRYYEWTDRSAQDVRDFVNMFLGQQQANPRIKFQLATTLKPTGKLIGSCGIRMKSAVSHEADLGFELDPQYWGRGYATEAARAFVNFGFTELRLHRIWSWCIADNQGSSRVLEKLGMRCEGTLRENEYFKDQWWDTFIYAILDREWEELTR
jgi:RimJ/RimL family protein N-acetyltransferase